MSSVFPSTESALCCSASRDAVIPHDCHRLALKSLFVVSPSQDSLAECFLKGVEAHAAQRGDSRSLIPDSPDAHPVALLFTGDGSQTIANPIRSVLNRLGATVAVTMTDIRQAKRSLGREQGTVDGFVGVGSDRIRRQGAA